MILRRALPRQTNRIVIAALLDAGGGVQDVSVSDSGAGSDAIAAVTVVVTVADSAAGTDQVTLGGSTIAVADSGTGSDALSIAVSVATTDSAAGADALGIAASASVADSGAGTDYVVGAQLTGACVAGVLTVDPTNGRYFRNDDGPLVLAGFHTWPSIQDSWPSLPITPLDFDEYLNALVSYGCNFTKAWILESAKDWGDSIQYYAPLPWARTGPGNAHDGRPKFDLTQFDQTYFQRLRERCIRLGNAGIYVCVQLFQGWHVAQKGYTTGDPWANHPMAAANNINSIDGDTNDDGIGYETRSTSFAAVYAIQTAYVEKVLTTLNDLDHIIYEIANEEDSSSLTWQRALVDHIQTYEAGLPKQHAVGMTVCWPAGDNQDLYDTTTIDWLSGNGDLTPDAASAAKVSAYDTDHINGLTSEYKWIFRALCQGHNPWYMDEWAGETYGIDRRSDAAYQKIRAILGYALERSRQIDLANATPQPSLASTGYCLAKTSGAYQFLVYQDMSGSFTLNLTSYAGTYSVEWLRTADGTLQAGSNVAGGATRTLTPPWAGEDAVAYLEQDVPKSVAESATGTESIAISVALGVVDTGVGADGPSGATVTLSLADTGAGADDTLQEILAAIADSGTAVDSLASLTVTFTLPDTAAGSEALIVAATVSVEDAGGGADAVSVLTEAIIQIADSGTGIDTVISPFVSVAVLDTGSGVDSQEVSVTLAVNDTGSAADLVDVITATLVSILDSGSGADALSITVDPLAIADSGAGSDSTGVAVSLTVTDTGSGADDVLQMILVAIADLATGTDAVGSITVNVPVADAGQAADVLGTIAAALSIADVGSGLDVAVQFDSAVKLVSIVFTLARRTVVFAWSVRSIEFGWNVA